MVQQGRGESKAGALKRMLILFRPFSEVRGGFSSVGEGQRQEAARIQARMVPPPPPPPGGLGSALGLLVFGNQHKLRNWSLSRSSQSVFFTSQLVSSKVFLCACI